jgi:hypothetical protein
MSRPALPHSRLLRLTDAFYSVLLHAYPRAFRLEFGAQMAQTLRADCRRVQTEHGPLGVLGLWVVVACDLAISALQEQLSQEVAMSRSTFVRLAGMAALIGGALFALSFVSHPPGLARAIVPASVAGLIVGILGLHARLWGREGRLGGLGFVLVGLGLALGLIGMAGSALGILDPNPIAPIINTGEHAGLVPIGAGMLLWGIVTLRERALGRWSILPLLMGLLSLSGIVFLIPAAFAALEASAMPEVFGLSWMLLGFALLTSRAGPASRPTQVAAA